MNSNSRLLLLALLAVSTCVRADEETTVNPELDNIAGQYAECAAYYRLVYHALVASNDVDTANKYREVEDTAMFYSLLLANVGRGKDLGVKVTNARIEMRMKAMKAEVGNRNENIAILINKHNETCKQRVETPPPQLVNLLRRRIEETRDVPQ